MKKTYVTFIVIILAVISLLTFKIINLDNKQISSSATSINQISPSDASNSNVTVKKQPFIVNAEADYLKAYRTFEEFIQDSTYIIKAKVIESQVISDQNQLYTLANVKIQKSFYGNLLENQNIELIFNEAILEGNAAQEYIKSIYTQKFGSIPDVEVPEQFIRTIDGQENFRVGDSLLLFLIDKPENVYGISNYNVVGAAQGRFLWKGNKIENHHLLNQQNIENLQSEDKSSLDADKVEKHLKKLLK